MLTSPKIPSSSRIRSHRLVRLGTRIIVYVCVVDPATSRLIWSLDSHSYEYKMPKRMALHTSDYLHPLDLRTAEVDDIGR